MSLTRPSAQTARCRTCRIGSSFRTRSNSGTAGSSDWPIRASASAATAGLAGSFAIQDLASGRTASSALGPIRDRATAALAPHLGVGVAQATDQFGHGGSGFLNPMFATAAAASRRVVAFASRNASRNTGTAAPPSDPRYFPAPARQENSRLAIVIAQQIAKGVGRLVIVRTARFTIVLRADLRTVASFFIAKGSDELGNGFAAVGTEVAEVRRRRRGEPAGRHRLVFSPDREPPVPAGRA